MPDSCFRQSPIGLGPAEQDAERPGQLGEHLRDASNEEKWIRSDKTFLNDPLVWTNVHADDVAHAEPDVAIEVTDGDHARVSVKGGIVFRYAQSGCRSANDPFRVVRHEDGWRIDRIPAPLIARALDTNCTRG
jgi:hypothetical protein